MGNLIKRTITGAIFVAIILLSLLNAFSFLFVFSTITFLTLREFYQIVAKDMTQSSLYINTLAGVFLFVSFFIYASGMMPAHSIKIFTPYLLYLVYTFISELYAKNENPISRWAYVILGQVYIALPFALINVVGFRDDLTVGVISFESLLPIAFFVFIWVNDTGAYLVGSNIGKHRLFERISPKKSWEGFWGGVVFVLLAAYLFSLFFDRFTVYEWLGMGLVVSVFSTWGDLCESLLKRTIHIKDSGSLLPGHGGMLDRVDSVLLAAPALTIYLAYIIG